MATIEVDIFFFLFVTIIGLFALPFLIGWTFWHSYKNPEFWLRLKRQDFVYVLIWNPLNKLLQIVVPLAKIGENGEFTLFKNRRYYWRDKYRNEDYQIIKKGDVPQAPKTLTPDPMKEGLPTVFNWKKKTGALFDWDDPMPQVRVPGQSLHSMTNPRALDALGAATDFKLMLRADDLLKLQRIAIMVSILGIVVLGGLAFAFYTQSAATNHLSCILSAGNNATIAAGCR